MKKILAIIGSPNDEKSNTVMLVRDFLDIVSEYDSDNEREAISLRKKVDLIMDLSFNHQDKIRLGEYDANII